jgi:hypothetical protein
VGVGDGFPLPSEVGIGSAAPVDVGDAFARSEVFAGPADDVGDGCIGNPVGVAEGLDPEQDDGVGEDAGGNGSPGLLEACGEAEGPGFAATNVANPIAIRETRAAAVNSLLMAVHLAARKRRFSFRGSRRPDGLNTRT